MHFREASLKSAGIQRREYMTNPPVDCGSAGWKRGTELFDMIESVHFRVDENDHGYYIFVAVESQVDYRVSDNGKRIELSWSGNDDGKVKSGRGRLEIIYQDTAKGYFFIHCGDEPAVETEFQT